MSEEEVSQGSKGSRGSRVSRSEFKSLEMKVEMIGAQVQENFQIMQSSLIGMNEKFDEMMNRLFTQGNFGGAGGLAQPTAERFQTTTEEQGERSNGSIIRSMEEVDKQATKSLQKGDLLFGSEDGVKPSRKSREEEKDEEVVVTSSDNKILAEEGPAGGSSTTREGSRHPLKDEGFEQEESGRDLQEQSIAYAEIQSLLRMPTISAVTSELLGEAIRAKASIYRESYRFKVFKFRRPPYRRSGYSSLEQDVFSKNVLSCEGDQRGGERKRKPARADIPVYLPGFHFLWWDPGGYNSYYILASRYCRIRRKYIAACADLSFYPSGPRYKLWDPGGYNSNILDNRVRP